jgi:hypothetical protein
MGEVPMRKEAIEAAVDVADELGLDLALQVRMCQRGRYLTVASASGTCSFHVTDFFLLCVTYV